MTNDYCESCGSKTIDEWDGSYNRVTGEKYMRRVCGINPCGHSGHLLVDNPEKFRGLFSYLFAQNSICTRCGWKGRLSLI